jgi:ATP-dependent Clp protease ATP-binding subunit ClpC
LSKAYFGKEDAMIRLDMSEYMERHSVSKLIGSPAGYIGYGDENQLTDRVRRKPYSLVLFDEVEKAHPDVLNLMLQMLEDGRLSDSSGRTVSFRNTLIVLTSNIGAQDYELNEAFSPEFLNRLDEIIPFEVLSSQNLAKIAEFELAKTVRRVKSKGVALTLSQEFKGEVIKQGFDATYGARPLRRTVVRLLDDELANSFLRRPFTEGDTIRVDVESDHRVVVTRSSDGVEESEGSVEFTPEVFSSEGEDGPMELQLPNLLQSSVPKSSDVDTESTKGSEFSEKVPQVSSGDVGASIFSPRQPSSEIYNGTISLTDNDLFGSLPRWPSMHN